MPRTNVSGLCPMAVLLTAPALLSLAGLLAEPATAAEFDRADIFYEFNSTDRDLGAQVSLDGENWKVLEIRGPHGREFLDLEPEGGLRQVGLTELFFEGAEPSLEEVPFSRFRQLVPDGVYTFVGRTVDNRPLRNTDLLTTDIACPARITAPLEGAVVPIDSLVIRWNWSDGVVNPDTERCNRGIPVELVNFEVIIDVSNEQLGTKRTLDALLPASARSLPIPRAFLEDALTVPGTELLVEVLAIEDTGNKTISITNFELAY